MIFSKDIRISEAYWHHEAAEWSVSSWSHRCCC